MTALKYFLSQKRDLLSDCQTQIEYKTGVSPFVVQEQISSIVREAGPGGGKEERNDGWRLNYLSGLSRAGLELEEVRDVS